MSKKIALKKHERNDASLGIAADPSRYPSGLSEVRYMGIKIFDTSKGDPNQKIAGSAGSVIDGLKNAFTSSSGGTDGLSVGKAVVALNSMWNQTAQGAKATIASMKEYGEGFEDAGNPPLSKEWKDTIWLPLPNSLTEDLSHEYSEETGLYDTVSGARGDVPLRPHTIASNVASLATGRQKLLYNENKMVQFSRSAFRSITLSWTLIPNNHKESLAIQEIITKLKAYSSPQHVASKLLLRAPFFCKLQFPNSYINEALQFNECVITNIQVDYSTSNAMETFSQDNMPKTMKLSITIKDREPKTLQAWATKGEKGYESAGHV